MQGQVLHNNTRFGFTSNHDDKQVVVIQGSFLFRELSQAKSLYVGHINGAFEINSNGERLRWWLFCGQLL